MLLLFVTINDVAGLVLLPVPDKRKKCGEKHNSDGEHNNLLEFLKTHKIPQNTTARTIVIRSEFSEY